MTLHQHILVVGVGSIGERHLRCFLNTKRASLVFCEPCDKKRGEIEERYGVRGFRSWEEAIGEVEVSAAIIASPAPTHIPLATEMTRKGVDLLIEKPLSLTMDGISRLTGLIEEKRTRVAVGYFYRTLPGLRGMREALLSGRFGSIVQIQVQAGQHFPFYRPAYREIYYADPEQGGGLIQDMLPHHLNAVEWIAGPTTRVVVDAAHQVLPGVEVEDTVHLLTRHETVPASYSVNQHQPVNETSITVNCERGAVRWEMGERWFSAAEPGGDWKPEESFAHERDDYYTFQAGEFLDFLEGKTGPPCSFEAGVTTLQTVLAILESRRGEGWVTVDLS